MDNCDSHRGRGGGGRRMMGEGEARGRCGAKKKQQNSTGAKLLIVLALELKKCFEDNAIVIYT